MLFLPLRFSFLLNLRMRASYGCSTRLWQKNAGRRKDGTESRSQRVTHRDGERSQREHAPPLYGADSAGVGRRRAAAGRTGVGLESWDDRAPVNTNWNTGLSASMHTHHEAANRVEEHLPNLLSDITAIVDG